MRLVVVRCHVEPHSCLLVLDHHLAVEVLTLIVRRVPDSGPMRHLKSVARASPAAFPIIVLVYWLGVIG